MGPRDITERSTYLGLRQVSGGYIAVIIWSGMPSDWGQHFRRGPTECLPPFTWGRKQMQLQKSCVF
jgi:hypothetical protein